MVTVSLVLWFPAFVMITTRDFCLCFSPLAAWFVVVLQLGNSMVNPFVLCTALGWQFFQNALMKCLQTYCWRRFWPFLQDFWPLSDNLREFSKPCSKVTRTSPNYRRLPNITKYFRRLPNIAEDFRGRPEDVSIIHHGCSTIWDTNLISVKLIIDIFTSEDI